MSVVLMEALLLIQTPVEMIKPRYYPTVQKAQYILIQLLSHQNDYIYKGYPMTLQAILTL